MNQPFFTFNISGSERFAIRADQIMSIIPYPEVSNSNMFIYRGQVVPVLDVENILNILPVTKQPKYMLVLRLDGSAQYYGFGITNPDHVIDIDVSEIQPVFLSSTSPCVLGALFINNELVTALCEQTIIQMSADPSDDVELF